MKALQRRTGDVMDRLKDGILFLKARRDALEQIAGISAQMLHALEHTYDADIDCLLDRREQGCKHYAAVIAQRTEDEDCLMGTAQEAADGPEEEPALLARSVMELRAESAALARQITDCQNQCQAILTERLQKTACALRESAQRRKLSAAYGPAHKRQAPAFVDKHR